MARSVVLSVLFAALFSILASATQADEPAPAPLDRAPLTVPLRVGDFELLPINDLEKQELVRDHNALVRRVMVLTQRMKKLRGHLAKRDRMDAGAKQLAGQIADIEKELAPLLSKAVEAVRYVGIDDDLLRHIASAPTGPHRVARYAAGLVLHVGALPETESALFRRIVPQVGGALLALEGQKERLRIVLKQARLDDDQQRRALLTIDDQIKRVENRFWRLYDYLAPTQTRAKLHRLLPTAYQKQESVLQYIFGVPGLTPAQGSRLKSMFSEIEAESSPDNAAVKRLRGMLAGTSGAERKRLEQEMQAAQSRLVDLQRSIVSLAKKIYTDDQWMWLEAIPPRVRFDERKQTSVDLLKGMALSPSQRTQLATMRESLTGARKDFRERRIAARAKMGDFDAEAPEMASVQMEMYAIASAGNEIQRRFNGRIFGELLTAAQIEAWVLEPRGP